MEPQAPATASSAAAATSSAANGSASASSQPSEASRPPPASSLSASSSVSAPNPNPNPNPRGPSPIPPTSRPPSSVFNRPHFPSPATSSSPSVAGPRGGVAIGVPAHHHNPSPPFPSSFGQHFGGLARIPDFTTNSPPVRPPSQGMGGGMLGSQMRPPSLQHRPLQSPLRPPSSQPNHPPSSQSFQGHGLVRASSAGSSASPSVTSSQGMQQLNQPWLSSGPPGKPPLPSASYRQHPPSVLQRSHIPPQQHSTPTASQQQQHPPLPSNQLQEHLGQQVPPSRMLHMNQQQLNTKAPGPGNQKPASLMPAQPSAVQAGTQNRTSNADTDEFCNRILSKRTIHELVSQVDPSEKLDPEVADVLVDIAENFLESITKSGCSLAKHRKSTMLEAKDILLHLEKNWNMTLPGFGGDEIKSYKKQVASDIHKERLTVIKKSMVATEAAHHKGSAGQSSGGVKGSQGKTPGNVFSSPMSKNS